MSVSTDGQISFGVICEEYAEFPWDTDEHDNDIESWWRTIRGYKVPFEPYTEAGDYAPGWSRDDPRLGEYYEHQRQWESQNPVPVELVNYCSGDYPMYAICVPKVGLSCSRGYPQEFDPESLVVSPEQVSALVEFLKEHGIGYDGEPRWLLTSYWG